MDLLSAKFPTLAVIAMAVAPFFALQPVRAAAPPHFAHVDGEPLHRIRADLDYPSLVVHLNADGSLVVSQRDKAGDRANTLPSIQALPAEIDALIPRRGERKELAVAVDSIVPYSNLMKLMNKARDAGFGEIGILEPEKEPRGGPSRLGIHFQHLSTMDPSKKALFMSLGKDGNVVLSFGLGDDATVRHVNLTGAPDAAVGLVPNGRAKIKAFFRADFEVPVGDALELLRELRAIGFTNINIVGEATGENH